MEDKSLEALFIQIQELLNLLKTSTKKTDLILSPEIWDRLRRLERNVYLFKALQTQLLEFNQINPEAFKKAYLSSKLKREKKTPEQKAFQTALDLEREAKLLRNELIQEYRSQNPLPESKISEPVNEKQQQRKERRKKFKSIGGDRGWIPL